MRKPFWTVFESFICSLPARFLAISLMIANFGLSGQYAHGAESMPEPLVEWYQALRSSDAPTLDRLLSVDATIDLTDLGISQTKTEFLDSLDEWKEANDGATILTRIEEMDSNSAIVDVCYRFASNEMLIRETFTLSRQQISGSVQAQISDNCEGF